MINYLIIASFAVVLSLGLTPIMIFMSRKWNVLDIPNERKAHNKPMPLMGGVAIYLATMLATVLYLWIFNTQVRVNIAVAFFIGISGVTMMGLIDDILSLSARRRLVILFILALIVLVGCLQFYFPADLFQTDIVLAVVTSIIIVLWIVGITNAINFTDGLDGLASCLSLVSALGFAVIFYLQGRYQLALPTTVALCGAILGFLAYNISPAEIFMGDAGSMFLGFMLGILSIMSISQKSIIVFVVPIFLMLLPIMDMGMAVLRRMILKAPLMKPDKMHFHHMLIKRIKSQRVVVFLLAAIQICFAAIGIVIYINEFYYEGWLTLAVIAVAAVIYTINKALAIKKTKISESN